MSQSPLDQPVSVCTLRQWHREGLIDDETFRQGLERAQPAASWQSWLSLELLVSGMALVLSGIIFFFAYNWQGMGRFEKLGLIEAALLACVLIAWRVGFSSLGGQVLILASTVMTGVFLAVFGQIYQTGADAYELFTGWAALTVVWVVVTRLEALWFLWLVIVQLGLILFWDQVMDPVWLPPSLVLFYWLAGINIAALIIRELCKPITKHHWLRVVLVAAMLTALTIPALDVIFDGLKDQPVRFIYVPAWLVISGACYWIYRFVRPDFSCVSLIAANLTVLVISAIFEDLSFGSVNNNLIVMSFIVVGATAGLTLWLSREFKAMKNLPA